MNQFVPDWNNMGDTSRPLGEDDDLIELLWCNGHVVMQSQTHRKGPPPRPDKSATAAVAAEPPPVPAPPPSVPQDDEAGLWFPFALADSLDKDIFSELFYEAPAPPVATAAGKPCSSRDGGPAAEAAADRRPVVSEDPCDLMPPPKSTPGSCSRQQTMSLPNGGVGGGDNAAGDLSDLVVRASSAGKVAVTAAEAGASSSMLSAIGSSICGSNQVLPVVQQRAVNAPGAGALPSAMGSANANAVGGSGGGGRGNEASSSGRSNYYCFGTTTTTTTTEPTSTSNLSSKRKRLDTTEDSESPSEDAESESAGMLLGRKPPLKMTTARRSRAAEVHNLSERRRRDRINEKMRALQHLIPHCNKTDKASMLDEAIEYLKSLQMQLQMMWMGSGIAAASPAVMFPGVHQYLPRMGVGMGAAAAAMPSMPRLPPFMAAPPQPVVPNAQVNVNPVPGFRGHMPAAVGITEPYGHYLGVNHHHHLQPAPSQVQQHYAQGVGYYPSPLGAKAVQVQVQVQVQQQQQAPELHHVPGPGGSMPAGAGAAAAAAAGPGVLPPENASSRGPAG